MNNQPTIAQQVIDLRERLNLTQAELGARLGVTGSAVGQWETGATQPRGKHRSAIHRLIREQQPIPPQVLAAHLIPADVQALNNVTTRLSEQVSALSSPSTPNPQTVTIDWQALVGVHDGVTGVSLRHLVNLGLYGKYQDAAAAIERDPRNLTSTVKITSNSSERGPAGEDYVITDLRAVQMFCARARTEMGSRILEVILSHHNELQAMLAGDADAQARHEQAKTPEPTKEIDPLDALSNMIAQLREQRDRQQALEREMETTRQAAQLTAELVTDATQRLADVEAAINTTPVAGHLSAYQIAQRGGYVSNKGRPHDSAVVALGLDMGLAEEGEAYQVMREINDHLCPSWRYTPNGAAMLSRELHRLANADDAPFFNIVAGTKTYTVYKTR